MLVEEEEFSPYEYVVDNIPESDTDEWKNLKDVMKTLQRSVVFYYDIKNFLTTSLKMSVSLCVYMCLCLSFCLGVEGGGVWVCGIQQVCRICVRPGNICFNFTLYILRIRCHSQT